MAHVMKIKQGAVAPLVAHYERTPELERGFVRGNIDPSRTALNYNLLPHDVRGEVAGGIEQHERTAGKAIRKDANVLFDWVVTMPKDCPPERGREFFEAVAAFMRERYGEGNVLGCYVHMDEATPHAHVPVVPMIGGKMQASKLVNRADLKTFHADLGRAVDSALGMHVSIELDERDAGEKQLSHLSQTEYVAAKSRLESLRREEVELGEEIEQLEPAAQTVAESAGALWKARNDGSREDALGSDLEGLRSQISDLSSQITDVDRRADEIERSLPRLRARCASLGERFEVARAAVVKAIEGLREVPNIVSEWAQELARKMGKPLFDPNSVDYMMQEMQEATRAAKALDRSREAPARSRGQAR